MKDREPISQKEWMSKHIKRTIAAGAISAGIALGAFAVSPQAINSLDKPGQTAQEKDRSEGTMVFFEVFTVTAMGYCGAMGYFFGAPFLEGAIEERRKKLTEVKTQKEIK
jgi:hypothetical protein